MSIMHDTTAYKVLRQLIDHTWGFDLSLDEEDLINIASIFRDLNGAWEKIMNGDTNEISKLESATQAWINVRKIASKIANRVVL